jgi:uncharacterized protein DUF3891
MARRAARHTRSRRSPLLCVRLSAIFALSAIDRPTYTTTVIVFHAGNRLRLITQPDHAQLSRQIMERCAPLLARPRRDTILFAIGEHDNGWEEEDACPRVNPVTGDVVDFMTAPAEVRQRVWPRAVARLSANPWAAALVAQHAITIFDRHRHDQDWARFFEQMQTGRDEMVRPTGMSLSDLMADYDFVRLADLISLTFCTGWSDEQRTGQWRIHRLGARVVIRPDPFAGAEVPMTIRARELRSEPFPSDAALNEALSGAAMTTVEGVAAGG